MSDSESDLFEESGLSNFDDSLFSSSKPKPSSRAIARIRSMSEIPRIEIPLEEVDPFERPLSPERSRRVNELSRRWAAHKGWLDSEARRTHASNIMGRLGEETFSSFFETVRPGTFEKVGKNYLVIDLDDIAEATFAQTGKEKQAPGADYLILAYDKEKQEAQPEDVLWLSSKALVGLDDEALDPEKYAAAYKKKADLWTTDANNCGQWLAKAECVPLKKILQKAEAHGVRVPHLEDMLEQSDPETALKDEVRRGIKYTVPSDVFDGGGEALGSKDHLLKMPITLLGLQGLLRETLDGPTVSLGPSSGPSTGTLSNTQLKKLRREARKKGKGLPPVLSSQAESLPSVSSKPGWGKETVEDDSPPPTRKGRKQQRKVKGRSENPFDLLTKY